MREDPQKTRTLPPPSLVGREQLPSSSEALPSTSHSAPSLQGRAGGESFTEPRAVADAFEAIYEGSFDDLKRALELKAAVMEFAEEERGPQSCIKQDLDILRTKAEAGDKQAVFSLYCSCLHAQNVLWRLANQSLCITMLDARCETMANILQQDIINLNHQLGHEKD